MQHSSTINKVTILYCVHTKNILDLFEELLYIIYDRHSGDMCAKYGRSRMNDAHTISPADSVGRPAKVGRLTKFFLKKKAIFVRLSCWPMAGRLVSQHMNSRL